MPRSGHLAPGICAVGGIAPLADSGSKSDRPAGMIDPVMMALRRTHCGGTELEPGFLEDRGDNWRGHVRWVAGELEVGIFGGTSRFGRRLTDVYRCVLCGHRELMARAETA